MHLRLLDADQVAFLVRGHARGSAPGCPSLPCFEGRYGFVAADLAGAGAVGEAGCLEGLGGLFGLLVIWSLWVRGWDLLAFHSN